MALATVRSVETPDATLLSSYTIERMGLYPRVLLNYTEVVNILEPGVEVTAAQDLDADEKYEVLTVPAWQGRSDLVGRVLLAADETALGTIVAFEPIPSNLTLDTGLVANPVGSTVCLQQLSSTGSLGYAPAPRGVRWEIILDMKSTDVFQYLSQRLGGAYFAAVKAALGKLELVASDEQVLAAISALAQEGLNIDSFIAQQGDAVELDRRNKALPTGVEIAGQAP